MDEGVEIGRDAVLHSLVTIYRDTRIGDDFLAHSQTVVRERCTIGNRVILQNGVVIGGDGFGFAKRADGRWHKIMQNAPVVIEDDVEIQANACIDRATVGETRIRRGAKIDDLVLVGHACEVGEDTILCGQVGLAGSTRVGNRVHPCGTSRFGGTPRYRRRRHHHRAERFAYGCSPGHDVVQHSRHREQVVSEGIGGAQALARNAEDRAPSFRRIG